jgi:hypothetical protein
MEWDITGHRFGLACFRSADPINRDGEGDGSEFFDRIEDAHARARKLLQAGRFKYLASWEAGPEDWVWIEEFW